MSNAGGGSAGKLDHAAQQRMQKWMQSEDLVEFMRSSREASAILDNVGPFIAVSRSAGSGGSEIARTVGEKLKWDVLDHELLTFMSERYHLPLHALEFVDESKANWVHDIFGNWFDHQTVSHEKYLVHLERILWLAAVHGDVVLVGRGANCVLPREAGLNVRITAPRGYCVEQLAKRENLSEEAAANRVDELDTGRADFVQRHFHHNIEDAGIYDLVIDASTSTIEAAADQIVAAYRERFEG